MPTAGHECSFSELMNPAPFQQLTLKLTNHSTAHVKATNQANLMDVNNDVLLMQNTIITVLL